MPAGFEFGFMPNPDDPNVQAAMLRQQQVQEEMVLKNLEWKDNFSKVLKNLDQTGMEVLSNIFHHVRRDPDAAAFYMGLIHGAMVMRFDTCPMCAEDHSEALHKSVEDGLKQMTDETVKPAREWLADPSKIDQTSVIIRDMDPTVAMDQIAPSPGALVGMTANQLTFAEARVFDFEIDFSNPTDEELEAIRSLAFVPPIIPLSDDLAKRAEEWGLDDAWEEGEPGGKMFLGWICTRCRNHYHSSIQDRMLKPNDVEGCPGCIQKQKWG